MLPIKPKKIHVWSFSIPAIKSDLTSLYEWLTLEEKEKLERFYFENDKMMYLYAHGMLRILLAQYLKIPRDAIYLVTDENGKPILNSTYHKEPLCFNLSHSYQKIAIGLCQSPSLGVDIEYIHRSVEFESIALNFFSERERLALRLLSLEQKRELFFYIWTRKEAILKAIGTGLRTSLDSFDVLLPSSNVINTKWMKWRVGNTVGIVKSFKLADSYYLSVAKITTMSAPVI